MDVAIAMPRRERALRAWVNAWVFEQLRSGRLNEIYRRHHGRDLPAELRPAGGR
jgi:polar amino acid transport system substrate-binding protein